LYFFINGDFLDRHIPVRSTGICGRIGQGLFKGFVRTLFFQGRILFHFLLDHLRQLDPGQLQQFNGLLKLRGHDQLLSQRKVLL